MKKMDEIATTNSCLNKAHNDEMIFVLRAKDPAAPIAIRAWIAERMRLGMDDFSGEKLNNAHQCAITMEEQREKGIK